MAPCYIVGGCAYPHLDGGSHVCRFCQQPVHNLCLQALTGAEDQPDGGFVCGLDGGCGKKAPAAPSLMSTRSKSAAVAVLATCAAGPKCTRSPAEVPNVAKTCCGLKSHIWCCRHPCFSCQPEEEGSGFRPGKIYDDTGSPCDYCL